jgi:hypothetical protein
MKGEVILMVIINRLELMEPKSVSLYWLSRNALEPWIKTRNIFLLEGLN